jgi:hypothetical protein
MLKSVLLEQTEGPLWHIIYHDVSLVLITYQCEKGLYIILGLSPNFLWGDMTKSTIFIAEPF